MVCAQCFLPTKFSVHVDPISWVFYKLRVATLNLKLHPIAIDSVNPFESDLLARKEEIENLTLLAINVNSPAVLAIDSPWGTGKTTFIKLWEIYLKSEGVPSLYFNAWETDFSDDPLVSFLGEMNEGLKDFIGDTRDSKVAWSKTKAAGKQIVKRSIPAFIKIGTAGIIDADKIVEDELSKAMGALAGDALDDYLKQKDAINEFHKELSGFVKTSDNGKPVVIFVDELDRCRPIYAIALLERIKHLFNIEGLVFVLALDKTQLCHSIGAVYGDGFDSTGYLKRFIDFEYRLESPDLKKYIESQITKYSLNDFFLSRKQYRGLHYDGEHLVNVFHMLATGLRLSLRDIEQSLANINLAARTAKENEYIHPALMAFLVISKQKNQEAYFRFLDVSSTEKELIEYLYKIVPDRNQSDRFGCALVEGSLIAAKFDHYSDYDPQALATHKDVSTSSEIDSLAKQYSEDVLNVFKETTGSGSRVNLEVLAKRIDLISRFRFDVNGA